MSPGRGIRLLIVDDEEPARRLLREYLDGVPDVEVAAECANGFEAVKAVSDTGAELLLLDVQMPKLDGFEVLELLEREIAVIFVTAYDEYSIRAFDVHAVDYLLKPFTRERFLEAIERARQRVRFLRSAAGGAEGRPAPGRDGGAREAEGDRAGALPESRAARAIRRDAGPLERILVRDGARVHVIPLKTILYIEAQDDYVSVVTKKEKHLKQQTLNELESQLDPARFIRIHRSYVLNIEALARIEPLTKDSRAAVLADGTELPVSRSGFERLKRLL